MLLIVTFVAPSIAFATRSLLLHNKVRHCQGKHPTHSNRNFKAFFIAVRFTIEIFFAIWEIWLSIFLYQTFLSTVFSIFRKRLFSEKVFKHQVIANIIFYESICQFLIANQINIRHRIFTHLKMQKKYSPGFICFFPQYSNFLGGANNASLSFGRTSAGIVCYFLRALRH